jgi:hypothetical protein
MRLDNDKVKKDDIRTHQIETVKTVQWRDYQPRGVSKVDLK